VTEIATGKVLKNFEGHVNHVLGVAWEHNGRRLWTAGADNAAKLWEFETGEKLKNLENFAKEVTSVSFIGLGGRAWLTAGDGQVIAVNDKGEKKSTMNGPEDYYYGGGASADGLIVVAGGASGVLRVWNGRDGSLVKEFRPSAP
jgi:WD40 repeat protein